MHYADIIAALKKADSSVSQIAADMGVTAPTVSAVIHSNATSRPIAKRIEHVTGIPVSKLFPGRYSTSGSSLPRSVA